MTDALHQAAQKAVEQLQRPEGDWSLSAVLSVINQVRDQLESALQQQPEPVAQKLWLWRNHVDGRPEYWAFDNPYPIHMDCGDPQTLGEPCGYALVKESRNGRPDVSEEKVIAAIKRAASPSTTQQEAGSDGVKERVTPAHTCANAGTSAGACKTHCGDKVRCWGTEP